LQNVDECPCVVFAQLVEIGGALMEGSAIKRLLMMRCVPCCTKRWAPHHGTHACCCAAQMYDWSYLPPFLTSVHEYS